LRRRGDKPSFRALPTVGVKTYSWTLDTVGLFAATVGDLGFALAALTGRSSLRVDVRESGPPRVGVVTQAFAGDPEPDSAQALEHAVKLPRARRSGGPFPNAAESFAAAWAAHSVLQDFEGGQALAWEYAHHRVAIAPLVGHALDRAQEVSVEPMTRRAGPRIAPGSGCERRSAILTCS
jgi:Asp-tRNA(Asn)/Glu-tRNA(Gln) amidotransferase A subunit family amidase